MQTARALGQSPTIPSALQSQNGAYSVLGQLKGHSELIITMSITNDGKLASGGIDGTRIWDLRKVVKAQKTTSSTTLGPAKEIGRPTGAGHRGATTALAWIQREDEPDDGLIFGTAEGYLVSWKETFSPRGDTNFEETHCVQLAKPGEITAIAFEAGSNRLATSNRNSVVQVFQVGPKLDLHSVFSVVVQNHIPKAIAFGQTGEDKDLYSFGLYDGHIATLSGTDGKVKHTRQTGGNAAINLRRGVFCIDDPAQGVALYRSDSWDRIRTYPVKAEKPMRPRQVAFSEDCKFIVSASDHGVVYVFDRRSGNMVDQLRSGKGRIQAVAAMEPVDSSLIFSAMHNGGNEACDIVVWRKNIDNPKREVTEPAKVDNRIRTAIRTLMNLCMLAMTIGFVWQNISSAIPTINPQF